MPDDIPANRKELESAALNVKEEIEHVRRQIAQCLDELDNPDADLDAVLDRYNALASKLQDTSDMLLDAADDGEE